MSLQEKWALEREAAEAFVFAFNELNSTHFKLAKHADKPDFTATEKDTNQTVGIEITHLFYDDEEAKLLLNRSQSNYMELVETGELIDVLNKRLAIKAEKGNKYIFNDPIHLVVRVASPLVHKSDFDKHNSKIQVPESVFEHTWLVFQDDSTVPADKIKQLQ